MLNLLYLYAVHNSIQPFVADIIYTLSCFGIVYFNLPEMIKVRVPNPHFNKTFHLNKDMNKTARRYNITATSSILKNNANQSK